MAQIGGLNRFTSSPDAGSFTDCEFGQFPAQCLERGSVWFKSVWLNKGHPLCHFLKEQLHCFGMFLKNLHALMGLSMLRK